MEEREHAAEFVDDELDGFTFERLQWFEAGGQRHQVAIFSHARTGMEFTLVPVGTFLMGSPEGESGRHGDETQHRVMLSHAFLIARTEVTLAVWERVMGTAPLGAKGYDHPVERVSWAEASEFCTKVDLALPTEAEWEYACRAGTTSRYSTGDSEVDLARAAWYEANSDRSAHPVGRKAPNAFGLFDVHGNVWEWCADWYGTYPEGDATDPTGPAGPSAVRVFRGGRFANAAAGVRSACRGGAGPGGLSGLGFRPVRSISIN